MRVDRRDRAGAHGRRRTLGSASAALCCGIIDLLVGWATNNARLAGFDREHERAGELQRTERLVRGDGVGISREQGPG